MDTEHPYSSPRRVSETSAVQIVVISALLLVCGFLTWRVFTLQQADGLFDPDAEPRIVTARGDLAADEKSQIELFKNAAAGVVHVTNLVRGPLSQNATPQGTGSGFIWNADGYVVTNYHVVKGAQGANVTLYDDTVHEARFVGADPFKDIAVLKINVAKNRLRPIPVGESANLLVGQKVYAIGNPFGIGTTLTTGIISGLGREISQDSGRTIFDVIQTDAAINPGNSGGPLLDSAGRLIGVNTAIYSPGQNGRGGGFNVGIGFAVPVDSVNQVVPQIIRDGYVTRPGLGISIWEDDFTSRLHSYRLIERRGVLIQQLVPDGAAADAGLLVTQYDGRATVNLGDLIVGIDGQPVRGSTDLFRILDHAEVGQTLEVTFIRQGAEKTTSITLQALPVPGR